MRIVLTTFGTLGDVHPLLALALELCRRGHTPVLAVPEIFRAKIEPLGLAFARVGPSLNPQDSRQVAMLMDIRKGTERTLREILFPAIRQSYQELRAAVETAGGADLMLSGELIYQAPLVAEMTGVPWASYVLAPLSFFSAYDAPVLPPYPALARLQSLAPVTGHAIARFARWRTRRWPLPVQRLRGELGLPRGRNVIFDAKHSPGLVLAMFSPLLGKPQPDWPPNTLVSGFVFYDDDVGKRDLSPEIVRFLQAGSPAAVFTLGSAAVLDAGSFFTESAQAVERLGIRAVMLVGADARNLPRTHSGSVCIAEYAPYSQFFPHASVVVHQGGVGTTAQALCAGKPMLIMPYSHDQPDNARRMQRLGVARTIRRTHYTAESTATQIAALLRDERVHAKALAAGDLVRAENGLGAACDALESFAARSNRPCPAPDRVSEQKK